ncbi:hypothetical protein [Geomicrobium sediminis]|uniref:YpzI family protein n=1 Tax=Geomicrobium sediminis TaxID=1347788 RepID=A0ABS2PJ80_9BACL|nr:hypothetical protein [Geomicrobium sediminis]MBM7635016.1 hypothetical protein [Geomicrobium sediminis]
MSDQHKVKSEELSGKKIRSEEMVTKKDKENVKSEELVTYNRDKKQKERENDE